MFKIFLYSYFLLINNTNNILKDIIYKNIVSILYNKNYLVKYNNNYINTLKSYIIYYFIDLNNNKNYLVKYSISTMK